MTNCSGVDVVTGRVRFFIAGPLEPAIGRSFPLPGAAAVCRRLEESLEFGTIALEVP